MSINRAKYYDNHTLYVTSGVAKEEQLYKVLKAGVKETEIKINKLNPNTKLECDVKVNLIVNKNREYYGFGYVRVSNESVYWMLLGKNPDGTDRVVEYPDPNWVAPTEKSEQNNLSEMSWFEIAQEEDKRIQPIIRENLGPLMVISGYKYDEMQYKHLQDMALLDGKDPSKVPTTGYFEFARAYTRDVEDGKIANVLCARQVPDWIPTTAFKNIFKPYVSDPIKKVLLDNKEHDNYPIVKLIDNKNKNDDRTVFITFDPSTKDAMFCLLMTRKVRIKHPERSELKCVIIFDHAYEQGKAPILVNKYENLKNNYRKEIKKDNKSRKPYDKRSSNKERSDERPGRERDDVDISKFNYAK